MDFAKWFSTEFGVDVPTSFAAYVQEYPRGAANGYGPTLWPAQRIREETEDRELAARGVCIVGGSDSITHILMRARDGKIIFVDSRDYEDIEATFQCVDVMIGLLKLEKI